jgi:hypothetical protein
MTPQSILLDRYAIYTIAICNQGHDVERLHLCIKVNTARAGGSVQGKSTVLEDSSYLEKLGLLNYDTPGGIWILRGERVSA